MCFKPLNSWVVCYTAIGNHNNIHFVKLFTLVVTVIHVMTLNIALCEKTLANLNFIYLFSISDHLFYASISIQILQEQKYCRKVVYFFDIYRS